MVTPNFHLSTIIKRRPSSLMTLSRELPGRTSLYRVFSCKCTNVNVVLQAAARYDEGEQPGRQHGGKCALAGAIHQIVYDTVGH